MFNTNDGYVDMPVTVGCGQCYGCRLEYSRQWAIRCMHEAQMHENNAFITLTYNDEHLPENKSIDKEVIKKFFKRLRKKLGIKIRYFACGEYGEKSGRPHYHALIFGYDFPDKMVWQRTASGQIIYRSEILESVWTDPVTKKSLGYTSVGEVTFESAAYVARYVMKKRKGNTEESEKYSERYNMVDSETGELHQVEPEFCLMSRGRRKDGDGGIGYKWYQKYKGDTDKDFITLRGMKMKIPKYYDSMLEIEDEIDYQNKKRKRQKEANKHKDDNTIERLAVKEAVKKAQTKSLNRGL